MTREKILKTAKPILFNTEMVRAIKDGRKTVTRRIALPNKGLCEFNCVKYPNGWWYKSRVYENWNNMLHDLKREKFCKYHVGDYLYVRETWATTKSNACIANELGNCPHKSCDTADGACFADEYIYKVDDLSRTDVKWRPSIHMPKEGARIFLRVTGVRVERLREITDEQALKEGFASRVDFISTFLKIYPSCTEESWVWVIEFERVEATE